MSETETGTEIGIGIGTEIGTGTGTGTGTETETETSDQEHHRLLQAIVTFRAGPRVAAPGVPIATGDPTGAVTLLVVVRAGDDGTAAAAGPGVLSGVLHLEGAPDGLHHATRLPQGGMIGFQTEHGPHAVTLTAETLDDDHGPRLFATAVTAHDLLSGALLQLDLEATGLTGPGRVPQIAQIAQIVATTDMARVRVTDSVHLSESEKWFPQPSHPAQIRGLASPPRARPLAALTSDPDHARLFHGLQLVRAAPTRSPCLLVLRHPGLRQNLFRALSSHPSAPSRHLVVQQP